MAGASIVGINSGFFQQSVIPFSPTDISGVTIWLGDLVNSGTLKTSLSNGANVNQWDDSSGNGYHLDTKYGQPTYVSATKGINLNPSGAMLRRSSSSPFTSSVVSTIFVAYTNAAVNWQYLFWLGNYNGNYYAPYSNSSNVEHENFGVRSWNGGTLYNATGLHTYITPSTDVTASTLRKNGVLESVGNAGSGTIGTLDANILLGGYVDGTTATEYLGTKNQTYYEIICYDRVLNATEIGQVETYLNDKYTLY